MSAKTNAGVSADTNASQDQLGQLLHLVAKSWRQELDRRLKPLRLTRAKWLALILISRNAGVSQRVLAEKMEVGEPAIVALIDRLEKDEFIVRKPVPSDRRARSLTLTAPGKRLISKIEAVVEALRAELLTGFSAAELKTTSEVIAQIKERIEALQ